MPYVIQQVSKSLFASDNSTFRFCNSSLGGEFFVGGLQLFLGGLQFLIGALKFSWPHDLCWRLKLFGDGFVVFNQSVQLFAELIGFALQRSFLADGNVFPDELSCFPYALKDWGTDAS